MVFPAIHLARPYVRARVTWYPVVTLCPIPHVPAIHLTRQSAFYGHPGHISSRDGIDLCPSSDPTPSRQHSRAHPLARCFAGRPPEGHLIDTDLPHTAVRARLVPRLSSSCNSSGKAIGLPGPSRAYQLARWHRFVSIERREPLQTALQGTFARAMLCRKITEDQRPATHGPQSPVSARLGPVKARPYAFLQFIWHPNRPSRALQGTFRFQVEPNCAHLDAFREPTA